jgi:hypothetical protein
MSTTEPRAGRTPRTARALDQRERRGQVEVQAAVPGCVVHVVQCHALEAGRARHHEVQAAEASQRSVHQTPRRVTIAQIGGEGARRAPVLADLRGRVLGSLEAFTVVNGHVHARGAEAERDGLADSLPGAGDERAFASKRKRSVDHSRQSTT